jgi:SAM-dependent methyltransferase
MAEYDATTYGERIAEVYDDNRSMPQNAEAAAAFLTDLAGERRVLELGIGTGRIAIPLAARGVRVSGIDSSQKMVARMRAKLGGDAIPVTIGDFADVKAAGQFSLIYVVFNTFFMLLTQEAQVRCFARAAKRLADGGAFVLEGFVPETSLYDRGSNIRVKSVETDRVFLHVSRGGGASQQSISADLEISAGGIKFYPIQVRYAWPSELDLMARLAGMRLRERWAGWNREPFTDSSGSHVSVYEKIPNASIATPAARNPARSSKRTTSGPVNRGA